MKPLQKIGSVERIPIEKDDDPDSNDEFDYDPDDNVELVQIEKKFYCHQCATETTLTYQFLKREDGTWICKPCLEKINGKQISTKQRKKKHAAFGFTLKNPGQAVRRSNLRCKNL